MDLDPDAVRVLRDFGIVRGGTGSSIELWGAMSYLLPRLIAKLPPHDAITESA